MVVNKTLFIIGLFMLAGGISFLVLGLTGTYYAWRPAGPGGVDILVPGNNPAFISTGAGLSVLGIGMLTASFIWKHKQ
jgi:hypothetical protein